MYILFDKTTHYATQCTLISLGEINIVQESTIFISQMLFNSIKHMAVLIINLTPRGWCVVILMLWPLNPG